MADLTVKEFGMINPFVVASSPATRGAENVIRVSKIRPGAIVLRNYGHGMGGGGFIYPNANAMYSGKQAFHSHAVGTQLPDNLSSSSSTARRYIRRKRESTATSSFGFPWGITATS